MLKAAGIIFRAMPPDLDESSFKKNLGDLSPKIVAKHLAESKAGSLGPRFFKNIIIGSDQTLEFEGRILNKPKSRREAMKQLDEMRGKTHLLHSAVCCIHHGKLAWSTVASARLVMRNFSNEFLERYLDEMGDEISSSVGGYKIERMGLQLFERVSGDHFVILGMPLLPLLKFLRRRGAILS